jgi:hypothetical protein
MINRERASIFASAWLFGVLGVFFLTGCGKISTHPVEGKITYKDGSPLTCEGLVIFNPAEAHLKNGARGAIQPDGSFRMGTFDEADGVPEGRYKVAIVPPPLKNPNHPPPDWPPFDRKYMNAEQSGLEFTVTAGKNEFPIVVEK